MDGQFPSTMHVHSTEISRGEDETFSETPERHFNSFEMIDSFVPDQNRLSSLLEIARPLQNDLKDDPIHQIEESSKAGGADEEVEKPPKVSEPLSEIPFVKCTVDEGCGTDEDGVRCLKQNEADSVSTLFSCCDNLFTI